MFGGGWAMVLGIGGPGGPEANWTEPGGDGRGRTVPPLPYVVVEVKRWCGVEYSRSIPPPAVPGVPLGISPPPLLRPFLPK